MLGQVGREARRESSMASCSSHCAKSSHTSPTRSCSQFVSRLGLQVSVKKANRSSVYSRRISGLSCQPGFCRTYDVLQGGYKYRNYVFWHLGFHRRRTRQIMRSLQSLARTDNGLLALSPSRIDGVCDSVQRKIRQL